MFRRVRRDTRGVTGRESPGRGAGWGRPGTGRPQGDLRGAWELVAHFVVEAKETVRPRGRAQGNLKDPTDQGSDELFHALETSRSAENTDHNGGWWKTVSRSRWASGSDTAEFKRGH